MRPPTFRIWNDHVSRVELSLPVKPSARHVIKMATLRDRRRGHARHDLLIGMLDDGCPFAAAHFR